MIADAIQMPDTDNIYTMFLLYVVLGFAASLILSTFTTSILGYTFYEAISISDYPLFCSTFILFSPLSFTFS